MSIILLLLLTLLWFLLLLLVWLWLCVAATSSWFFIFVFVHTISSHLLWVLPPPARQTDEERRVAQHAEATPDAAAALRISVVDPATTTTATTLETPGGVNADGGVREAEDSTGLPLVVGLETPGGVNADSGVGAAGDSTMPSAAEAGATAALATVAAKGDDGAVEAAVEGGAVDGDAGSKRNTVVVRLALESLDPEMYCLTAVRVGKKGRGKGARGEGVYYSVMHGRSRASHPYNAGMGSIRGG